MADNGDGSITINCPDSQVTFRPGPVAPETIEGHYTIQNSFDAAALNGVRHITGWLEVTGAGIGTVDLPGVETVGALRVEMQAVTSLSAPSLTRVHADLTITNNEELTSLDLSVLDAVMGNLTIYQNYELCVCDVEAISDRVTVDGETNTEANNVDCRPC